MIVFSFISGVIVGIISILALLYYEERKMKRIRLKKRMLEINQAYYSKITGTIIEQNVN